MGLAPLIKFPFSSFIPGFHGLPVQSIPFLGGDSSPSSHQTVLSGLRRTLVKIVFSRIVFIALGFDFKFVPGATPKNPFSGFIAQSFPSESILIQAMSSPTVHILYPFLTSPLGGISIARFVLPHALGKAAAIYSMWPFGSSIPRISICSAIHPSLFPI